MKTVNLSLDYPKRLFPEPMNGEASLTTEQLSLNVISSAVNALYSGQQRQMGLSELRIWSKVMDRLMDESGKALAGEHELEDAQFDFIYEKVTKAEYPPAFAPAVTVLVDALEKVKLEAGKEKKE